MGEHAKLSPSAFGRWSLCPGSVHKSKGLPDNSSAAAQWGTDAHFILEKMVDFWFNSSEPMPVYEFDDVLEKTEVAQVAFDYMVKRYDEAEAAGLRPEVQNEARLYTERYTGRKDLWGSGDIILSTTEYVEVIDLKAGKGIMVSPDSGQLKIYALGEMAHSLSSRSYTDVITTIVQPRIPHADGPVRSEHYTVDELELWCLDVLIPACDATDGDNAELVPGNSQCQFCKAKPTCTAVADKVQNLAMSVFEDQTGKTIGDVIGVNPEELPIDKIVEIIENGPLITGWIKSIEKYAADRLKNREEVPGYKMVHAAGRNVFNQDADEVVVLLAKGKGCIKKALLTKTVSLSAPQALKIKDLSEAQRTRLQSFIVKSQGSLQLVPVTDKRADAFPPVQFQDMSFLD